MRPSAPTFLFTLFATLTLTACGGETGGPDEPNTPDEPIVTEPDPDGECPSGMVLKQDTLSGPRCLSTSQPNLVAPSEDSSKEPDPEADAAPDPEEDATAPPDDPPVEELHSCSDFMNDPDWSWVEQANGRRFMCGQGECTFELLDGPDGCEAKCQPEFYELVEELEHTEGTNFEYYTEGVGTLPCNAM